MNPFEWDKNPTTINLPILAQTCLSVERREGESGGEEIIFQCVNGTCYRMRPGEDLDCGNEVDIRIESIEGRLEDLVGKPICMAQECSNKSENEDSDTWTFYRFATTGGWYVTMRWCGNSNGHYCEKVVFEEIG